MQKIKGLTSENKECLRELCDMIKNIESDIQKTDKNPGSAIAYIDFLEENISYISKIAEQAKNNNKEIIDNL